MFIKPIIKGNKPENRYTYYRLCQSIRIGKKTRHENLLNLGRLNDLDADQRKTLANRIEALYKGLQMDFFVDPNDIIELFAQDFYSQLRDKCKEIVKSANVSSVNSDEFKPENSIEKDIVQVDINSLVHESALEVGAEWLCLQTIKELGIDSFLAENGFDKQQQTNSIVHLIGRAVYPASEHKTAQWIASSSAIKELVLEENRKINHQHLYKSALKLYEIKDEMGTYLSKKTNELFDITDKIVFYDLTNTYFEGRKVDSEIAQFGRSKEKRSDAKLLSLALVVNAEGFVKYSKIYKGNIFEAHTLLETIEALSKHSTETSTKPIVVMDAGFSTEENVTLLKEKGYDYLCVSRTKLKEYTVVKGSEIPKEVTDNRGNKIALQRVSVQENSDNFMYIRSEQKALKEASMENRYCEKLEAELNELAASIHKKGCTKNFGKVNERIGRIKERYSYANKYYEITVEQKEKNASEVRFIRKELKEKTDSKQGVYFLRTSVATLEEETIWDFYNTLTEVEATFRTLKTDLHIRPVFHKNDKSCEAHIHLGVLAYMVVNTIRYRLKQNNIHHDWRNIVRIMNTQKLVTSSIKKQNEELLIIKKCSQPNKQATEIYNAMKFKPMPFFMKKFVLPL